MKDIYPVFTSSVHNLGFVGDIAKTSLQERNEFRDSGITNFSNFFLTPTKYEGAPPLHL